MNKPDHPRAAAIVPSPRYDDDAYGWAMAQARHLRDRRFDAIDWDNVAEEIESMGRGEVKAARSQLRVALIHRLKWLFQPGFRGRSWTNSVREHLKRFDRELRDNPSLKSQIDQIKADAYSDARYEAAQETGLDIDIFPEEPPSWDEIRGPLPD
jgi:hypothetical protein